MSQYNYGYMYCATFESSSQEKVKQCKAGLKKSLAYKKSCISIYLKVEIVIYLKLFIYITVLLIFELYFWGIENLK